MICPESLSCFYRQHEENSLFALIPWSARTIMHSVGIIAVWTSNSKEIPVIFWRKVAKESTVLQWMKQLLMKKMHY
ncbi:hypothetical protein GVAV_002949 [Gurleya vavrai]